MISNRASGTRCQDKRPRLDQRRVALLRLEPRDHPDERRSLRKAVLLGQRAARFGERVLLEVNPVVDELDRRRGSSLSDQLGHDRPTDRDQPIHRRRQPAHERPIFLAPDPARMDGADNIRPRQSGLGQRQRSTRADDLGAIHVVVDHVRRARL